MWRRTRCRRGCSSRGGGSAAFGKDDAGNSCVVIEDADVVPEVFRQESADGRALAEAEYERGVGLGDEKTVDGQSVGAGEEREVGFVVADFGGESGCVGE